MSSHEADAAEQQQGPPITVTIFDQPFRLRSPRGVAHVSEVARLVDERMRQVAAHLTTYDVAKIAILAALNLADELHSVRSNDMLEEQHDAPAPPAAAVGNASSEQSWFEAIFDTPATVKPSNERLSAQVAAKLQAQRPAQDEAKNEAADNELA